MFLISPYSPNLSTISSSPASSWTLVINNIHPSTAIKYTLNTQTSRMGPDFDSDADFEPTPVVDSWDWNLNLILSGLKSST